MSLCKVHLKAPNSYTSLQVFLHSFVLQILLWAIVQCHTAAQDMSKPLNPWNTPPHILAESVGLAHRFCQSCPQRVLSRPWCQAYTHHGADSRSRIQQGVRASQLLAIIFTEYKGCWILCSKEETFQLKACLLSSMRDKRSLCQSLFLSAQRLPNVTSAMPATGAPPWHAHSVD